MRGKRPFKERYSRSGSYHCQSQSLKGMWTYWHGTYQWDENKVVVEITAMINKTRQDESDNGRRLLNSVCYLPPHPTTTVEVVELEGDIFVQDNLIIPSRNAVHNAPSPYHPIRQRTTAVRNQLER